jgi:hypothetical protein
MNLSSLLSSTAWVGLQSRISSTVQGEQTSPGLTGNRRLAID